MPKLLTKLRFKSGKPATRLAAERPTPEPVYYEQLKQALDDELRGSTPVSARGLLLPIGLALVGIALLAIALTGALGAWSF